MDADAIERTADFVDSIAGEAVAAVADGDEAVAAAILKAIEARILARVRAERARAPRLAARTDAGRPRPLRDPLE